MFDKDFLKLIRRAGQRELAKRDWAEEHRKDYLFERGQLLAMTLHRIRGKAYDNLEFESEMGAFFHRFSKLDFEAVIFFTGEVGAHLFDDEYLFPQSFIEKYFLEKGV